jgi:hypothetical protein
MNMFIQVWNAITSFQPFSRTDVSKTEQRDVSMELGEGGSSGKDLP